MSSSTRHKSGNSAGGRKMGGKGKVGLHNESDEDIPFRPAGLQHQADKRQNENHAGQPELVGNLQKVIVGVHIPDWQRIGDVREQREVVPQ